MTMDQLSFVPINPTDWAEWVGRKEGGWRSMPASRSVPRQAASHGSKARLHVLEVKRQPFPAELNCPLASLASEMRKTGWAGMAF